MCKPVHIIAATCSDFFANNSISHSLFNLCTYNTAHRLKSKLARHCAKHHLRLLIDYSSRKVEYSYVLTPAFAAITLSMVTMIIVDGVNLCLHYCLVFGQWPMMNRTVETICDGEISLRVQTLDSKISYNYSPPQATSVFGVKYSKFIVSQPYCSAFTNNAGLLLQYV